jgi:methionine-rich copper-binding protein CopC
VPTRGRIALALVFLWLAQPISPAAAHSSLISSTPVVNATVAKLPAYVAVTFDENLLLIGGTKTNILQVADANGIEVDVGNPTVAGPLLRVDIKDSSGEGVFTVKWRVVSGDGHPAQGSYKFTVGSALQITVPTQNVVAPPRESFWNRQKEGIYLVIAAFMALGIWLFFDRRRRKAL